MAENPLQELSAFGDGQTLHQTQLIQQYILKWLAT
jgi:hypothetical protein